MYINFYESKEKFSKELSNFLESSYDGVFYIGHASILVRLNKDDLDSSLKACLVVRGNCL